MGDFLAADVSGREALEKEFNVHASVVKTYFTLNGQHIVELDGEAFHFPNKNDPRDRREREYYGLQCKI